MVSSDARADSGVAPDRPRCLDAALDYAERGISVVLLHGIVDGQCTCGKSDCTSPGKHPIGGWKDAQTVRASPERIRAAFSRHPDANVGIVTGAISGVVVIDIDGEDGRNSVMKILRDRTPELPTVATGKGYHYYGRHPGGVLKNFVKTHPGIDGRADGGYVVAPPSRHIIGQEYRWTRPLQNPLRDLPAELLDLFASRGKPAPRVEARVHATGEALPPEPPSSGRRVPEALKRYAESAFTDECGIVAAAPVGQQEITLGTAGLKIGRYVGAGLLAFAEARDALVEAGLQMVNDRQMSRWTRAAIVAKVSAKLREGIKYPKWGPDPRGESDDQTSPLDIFGDIALTGQPVFPVDVLPIALEPYVVDRAGRLGVDPSMIAMPALAACAAALDDRYVVQVRRHDEQWVEPARLWVALIEDPGGKKTPAIDAALAPVREIENAWHSEDQPKQADYELAHEVYREERRKHARKDELARLFSGLTEPVKPPLRRLVVSDTTTEALAKILADNPAGVIGHFDELAQLLGSFDAYRGSKASGRDRAIWLQLYNGGQQLIDRVGSGHLRVQNWSASVVGGIQPGRLRKLLPDLTDDGFLQRFVPIFGSGPSRGIDRPADQEADRGYRDLLANILALRTLPPVKVTLSPEAHEARERVMKHVEALLALPNTPGPLKNHLNKWEALFARLLLTVHAAAWAPFGFGLPDVIQGPTACGVEKLMLDYLLPNALRFYNEFYGRDEHAQHACWVAGHILAHSLPVITERDIYRAYNALRENEQALDRALSYLEGAGWIVPMTDRRVKRMTQWWVDPRVHQLFAERAAQERVRRAREVDMIREATEQLRQAS